MTVIGNCQHQVFDASNDGTGRIVMRDCKRAARYAWRHSAGYTYLCRQHYRMRVPVPDGDAGRLKDGERND